MPMPATARAALDKLGIDSFCDRLINGETYRSIARSLKIDVSQIHHWIAADSQRSTRARDARIQSAHSMDEKAEEVLLDPKIKDPMIRRELASHYRWRAKMMNPREYGEKLQLDANHSIVSLSDEQIAERRAKLRAQLDAAAGLPPPLTDED